LVETIPSDRSFEGRKEGKGKFYSQKKKINTTTEEGKGENSRIEFYTVRGEEKEKKNPNPKGERQ